ncbi:MAG: hypothetical protein JXA22_00780 [Candidatus Thermoplasmatota archaeon]|nr:hypothetical protein [Candidatus Thermoplasmatota archaeon]
MEAIGDLTWREYYSRERVERSEYIDEMIRKWWKTEDEEVEDILSSGGFLSFPHTLLRTSLEPVIRTVRAIYRTGKKRVIAFGVMHAIQGWDPKEEFSLDTFKYVLDRTASIIGGERPELVELFLPRGPRGDKGDKERMQEQIDDSAFLGKMISDDTAVVLTGDLMHYGDFYERTGYTDGKDDKLEKMIEKGLELIFSVRDKDLYFQNSRSCGNDQWASVVAITTLIPDDLAYRIFSMEFSDYSPVFQTSPPCLVASVMYGAWPLKKGP